MATHIYPARWSFNTALRIIEILDDSLRESGKGSTAGHGDGRSFGQSPEESEERFMRLLSDLDDAIERGEQEAREQGWHG